MTKKDYEVIAQGLRVYRDYIVEVAAYPENAPLAEANAGRLEGAEYTISYLVRALAENNPRFDREKFYAALGMN